MVSDSVHLSGWQADIAGAVLIGGRSSRFGSDKALFAIADQPMARVVAEILHAANIDDVFVVGDSQATADALGLAFVADAYPGEGPLGGIISVMRNVPADVLCILPCDVPRVSVERVRQLIDVVVDSDVTDMAILATSQDHWLCSSWRVRTCLPVLTQSFATGERSIHRAAGSLVVRRISATDAEMINVNTRQEALEVGRIIGYCD